MLKEELFRHIWEEVRVKGNLIEDEKGRELIVVDDYEVINRS